MVKNEYVLTLKKDVMGASMLPPASSMSVMAPLLLTEPKAMSPDLTLLYWIMQHVALAAENDAQVAFRKSVGRAFLNVLGHVNRRRTGVSQASASGRKCD